jgi:hypothetical protein
VTRSKSRHRREVHDDVWLQAFDHGRDHARRQQVDLRIAATTRRRQWGVTCAAYGVDDVTAKEAFRTSYENTECIPARMVARSAAEQKGLPSSRRRDCSSQVAQNVLMKLRTPVLVTAPKAF